MYLAMKEIIQLKFELSYPAPSLNFSSLDGTAVHLG